MRTDQIQGLRPGIITDQTIGVLADSPPEHSKKLEVTVLPIQIAQPTERKSFLVAKNKLNPAPWPISAITAQGILQKKTSTIRKQTMRHEHN